MLGQQKSWTCFWRAIEDSALDCACEPALAPSESGCGFFKRYRGCADPGGIGLRDCARAARNTIDFRWYLVGGRRRWLSASGPVVADVHRGRWSDWHGAGFARRCIGRQASWRQPASRVGRARRHADRSLFWAAWRAAWALFRGGGG